jgi:hypothetical protein
MKKDYMLFLFNDILLITSPRNSKKEKFDYVDTYPLDSIEIIESDESPHNLNTQMKHYFTLSCLDSRCLPNTLAQNKTSSLTFTVSTLDEKCNWIRDIERQKAMLMIEKGQQKGRIFDILFVIL